MIIAHKNDELVFQTLLNQTLHSLQSDADSRNEYYLKQGGKHLEKIVFEQLCLKAKTTLFDGNIELVSGQKFPDIVAFVNKTQAFGLEVKTTSQNKWKSTGSSIFEGTRVDNVSRIHLLFGKLHIPVEFKCRPYESCLYDVAITHSPRYLIDMELEEHNNIFEKIGVAYDELRYMENPFAPIKQYYRSQQKYGDDVWWIDNNQESHTPIHIQHWVNLSADKKQTLKIQTFAHFPSIFNKDRARYNPIATWLVSRFNVVNHALRDSFTAGGQIKIDGVLMPKIFENLSTFQEKIEAIIPQIDREELKYYWSVDHIAANSVEQWRKLCVGHANTSLTAEQLTIFKKIILKR